MGDPTSSWRPGSTTPTRTTGCWDARARPSGATRWSCTTRSPSGTATSARPSHYVALTDEQARRKVALLNKRFPSQLGRDWWDDEMFLGLMRIRGMECRSRYAEAFFATKVCSTGSVEPGGQP